MSESKIVGIGTTLAGLERTDVDQRIDVYGLGVLLYEALSAKSAFEDGHVGPRLMKIAAGDCLPLDAVADVVRKAMHHDKTSRYTNGAELLVGWREARSR